MFAVSLLGVLLGLLFRSAEASGAVLVAEGLGTLQGLVKYTDEGKPFYSFQKIPYAEPPVGELRFKDPVEKAPVSQSTVVDATAQGPACLQYNRTALLGEEDCLFINVYTPSYDCQSACYPVVVFIYGGAFMSGDTRLDPNRVVDRDIVVVTVNYRVGVLGFLSSGDEYLPGNMGLLDQQLGLQWVQKNIHNFCGDRNQVTLAGQSAGSASVTLHMVSPGSRGLFHQTIGLGGVFMNPWAGHSGAYDQVRALAGYVGCCGTADQPIPELVACMRSINGSVLVKAETNFQGWEQEPFSPFGAVIDGKFLPCDPGKLLAAGKFTAVPTLLSHLTQEALQLVGEFSDNITALRELDQQWLDIAPLLLDYCDTACTQENRDCASIQIRTKYFGNAPITKESIPQLIKMMSDRHFVAGVSDYAKALASARGSKPVYLYQYGYRAQFRYNDGSDDSPNRHIAARSDDLNLIMPTPDIPPLTTQSDKNMSRSLIDVWECFIKTGVPRTSYFPEWTAMPTSGDRLVYLNISGYNDGALKTEPEQGQASFWRSLPLLQSDFTSCHPIYGAS